MKSLATGTAAARPLRVLLVEDAQADAELLTEMLLDELPDASCTTAHTLRDALAVTDADVRIDIVVTDLSLPDAEGLQALHVLRRVLPDCPVLVLTGRDDRDTAMAALAAGADDYLVKGARDGRAVATAVLYAVQRRRTEREARGFERLALSLLDAIESPTCAVDARGRVVAVNAAWAGFAGSMTGGEGVLGIGGSYFDVCRAAGPRGVEIGASLRQLLAGGLDRFELDCEWETRPQPAWYSVRINPLPDGVGAVLTHVDVTPAKLAELALAHRTMHDVLTDLPNRLLLNDRLVQALAAAERSGRHVAVCFLDLDQFKRINDSLGHAAGDELIVAVAHRLRPRVRAGDTLARFAGDEFVVVWPDLGGAEEADALAERVRGAFEEPFVLRGTTVSVTASLGIAVVTGPRSPDDVLLAADAAMYDAKSHGRGLTRTFSSELRAGAQNRVRTEAELRQGLERDEFVLHYQPVVDLRRGVVTGVEALVRWDHPDGLRSPDKFVPVAESSGLIVPLGAWVLGEACRQAMAWDAEGLELDVAVNLSVRQVSHPDVLQTVKAALARTGLPPQRLLLEVTESAVMEDAEAAQVALEALAGLGASIAIDDFGTGYSSLLYLKRYPVGALKIDRSFVSGIGVKDDDAIIASIVSLARAVGSVCIAEGVETPQQRAMLTSLGCDLAQGYLFSRPVPAAEVPAAVRAAEAVLQDAAGRTPAARASEEPATLDPAVLARITELRQAGASAHTIAAALNSEGAPHPQQIRWHRVAVAQIAQGFVPRARRRSPAAAGDAGDAAGRRPPRRGAQPSRHVVETYAEPAELTRLMADGVERALRDTAAAAFVIAAEDEQRQLDQELGRRGLDLVAARRSGRYATQDSATVLGQITLDGYVSARLFRSVVGAVVRAAAERHGAVWACCTLGASLCEQGDPSGARAVEDHWTSLTAGLPVDLVRALPRSWADTARRDVRHLDGLAAR